MQVRPTPPSETPESDDTRMLLDYLAQRDAPCPACGYNLRQLTQPRCPECGKTLRLCIGVTGGMHGAWIAALVAVVLPAGCGLPFNFGVIYALGDGVSLTQLVYEVGGLLFAVLLYMALCLPLTIALISGRRRFQRLSGEAQKMLAFACWVIDAILVIAIITEISGW